MILRRPVLLALLGILALTALAYAPGLRGGFLFDDFVNLDALGATGPVDDWPTLWRYLSSGDADPTGRPLSLLSFLLDARDWPASPQPFLRTNLLLHLGNGVLLFALLRVLGTRLDGPGRRSDATAALAAGLWLLHPLLVSTTLYIVQREAMLPATFILLGLLAWLRGDRMYASGATRAGATWMCAGIVGGTVLATLCKANGLLLPALALAIDATVLKTAAGGASRPGAGWRRALLVLPTLAILALLLSRCTDLWTPIGHRGWSRAQRLLTEPRVLIDYLVLWFVPRSVSTGLYNDGYVVSTSLLSPLATLPSLLFVLLSPIAAWVARRRAPALAAAVLFFAAGHLLESTVVPLELYFEHRNYIPALLLCWPLARSLARWRASARARIAVGAAALLLLAVITFQRTSGWGDPDQLARLWAIQNPDSARAQATLAMTEARTGDPIGAMERIDAAWRKRPAELQLALNYANAACLSGRLPAAAVPRIGDALRQANQGLPLAGDWLATAISLAGAGECQGLGLPEVQAWLAAAEANPLAQGALGVESLAPLHAQLALQRRDPDEALGYLKLALAARATPDMAALQASTLATAGYYRHALALLDYFETLPRRKARLGAGMPWLHQRILEQQGYWPREMAILRGKLREEIAKAPVDQRQR